MVASSRTLLIISVASLATVALTLRLLPGHRRWGPELTGWGIAYPLYIFMVSSATFSVARYLLLAFPLALLWGPPTPSQRPRDGGSTSSSGSWWCRVWFSKGSG
jgi:hypothetical protein